MRAFDEILLHATTDKLLERNWMPKTCAVISAAQDDGQNETQQMSNLTIGVGMDGWTQTMTVTTVTLDGTHSGATRAMVRLVATLNGSLPLISLKSGHLLGHRAIP